MKEVIIAFDINGTLLNDSGVPAQGFTYAPATINLEVVLLIQLLSKHIKNSKVILWSIAGKDYAEQVCHRYGLEKYIHRCFGKAEYDEVTYGKVDICFDDLADCSLADKNLIIKMK